MRKILCLIAAAGFTCGCSMINPYQSEFSCPDTFKGKCASVREVYLEDAAGSPKDKAEYTPAKPLCTSDNSDLEGEGMATNCPELVPAGTRISAAGDAPTAATSAGSAEERNYNQYRSALYDKLGGLLKEPQTPVVAPPKVMRMLLLPYTGQDNEFYMLRYVYFFVDKPRWILGDSVTANGEEE